MVVRYAARFVIVGLLGGTRVEVSASDMNWLKKSLSSLDREEREDGRFVMPFVGDAVELLVAPGAVVEFDVCRNPWPDLVGESLTLGEVKRERMLRNADFFGGMGRGKRVAGSLGFFT